MPVEKVLMIARRLEELGAIEQRPAMRGVASGRYADVAQPAARKPAPKKSARKKKK